MSNYSKIKQTPNRKNSTIQKQNIYDLIKLVNLLECEPSIEEELGFFIAPYGEQYMQVYRVDVGSGYML